MSAARHRPPTGTGPSPGHNASSACSPSRSRPASAAAAGYASSPASRRPPRHHAHSRAPRSRHRHRRSGAPESRAAPERSVALTAALTASPPRRATVPRPAGLGLRSRAARAHRHFQLEGEDSDAPTSQTGPARPRWQPRSSCPHDFRPPANPPHRTRAGSHKAAYMHYPQRWKLE
jgi:hypothetical protein